MRGSNEKHWAACALVALSAAACTAQAPPYGEVVLEVDTDVSPSLAQRLQVDAFSGDGRWLTTRTLPQDFASDWPVSFSVVAPFDDADTEALVRLRLFPAARLRGYGGIRYEEPTFEPAFVPNTVEQACADPPTIRLGEARWQRRGITSFMSAVSIGTCSQVPVSKVGSTVARVEIATEGDYVFEILDTVPPIRILHTQVSLQLRGNCFAESSALMCDLGVVDTMSGTQLELPRIEAEGLAPGTYYLVTTGAQSGPADLLVAARLAGSPDVTLIDDDPELPITPEPLRLADGTLPELEPLPSVTVDRLVAVDLRDGERATTKVTLRGECFGSVAQLSSHPNEQRVVLDEAVSCIDETRPSEPVAMATKVSNAPAAEPALLGGFPKTQSCDGVTLPEDRVCVPGGVFTLGANDVLVSVGDAASSPERVVVIDRFAIDRREVTVGQWRASGFVLADFHGFQETEGPFASPLNPRSYCTYTSTVADPPREDFPMNCVSWWNARAYCLARDGDLPTAGQWEYVATAAGRERETPFPWGDDFPVCSLEDCPPEGPCHMAVFSRRPLGIPGRGQTCTALGLPSGPTSVLGYEDPVRGDATVPLHDGPNAIVFGLAGGVAEFTRDSFHSYDSRCWNATTLHNPSCFEELSVLREGRGAGWSTTPAPTVANGRDFADGAFTHAGSGHGFRCVYPIDEGEP